MNQTNINKLIKLVCKIRNFHLNDIDLIVINDYLNEKIDYDIFIMYFDNLNKKYGDEIKLLND